MVEEEKPQPQPQYATREELQALEKRLTKCKRDVEGDMKEWNERLQTLCAAVSRIETNTKKTAEIVEVWNNGKSFIRGLGLITGFVKRTWVVWAFIAACISFVKTGHWPWDWFKRN